jgi:hypothetical protein
MKFNLKNRPKTVFSNSGFTKWFEGFEKEIRELLKHDENELRKLKSPTLLTQNRIRIELLRQIVGDEK